MIEMLQKHKAWPFLGVRSRYSRASYQPDIQFDYKSLVSFKHDPPVEPEEPIDDNIQMRIEAARKAKREKWGDTVTSKDIEAYLTK